MMYSYIAAAALAGSVSASVLPRTDGCCFQLTASGGESGTIGQLGDGQNRIGGGYTPATYCINNGEITDSSGRGCILTPPTTQFQCDVGATPTSGFSISGSGEVEYDGSGTFYACGATSNEYNLYTKPVEGQKDCHEVKLSSGGKCAGNGGAGQSSSASAPKGSGTASAPAYSSGTASAPAYSSAKSTPAESKPTSSMPAYSKPVESMPAPSKPAESKPASSMSAESKPVESIPAPSKPAESKPASSMPAYSKPAESKPVESMPAPSKPVESMPAPSKPAESKPASSMPAYSKPVESMPVESMPAASQPAVCPPAATVTVTVTQACSSATPPASSPMAPASSPMAPASSPMAPASSPMAPASSPMAPAYSMSKSASPPAGTPATPAGGSACQTSLSGAYQTPHLIVPISSDKPDVAHGTSYFGEINSTTSSIFNFDVPSEYAGKQCSIVFLFPQKKDLTTADYTFSGSGSLGCSELSSAASQKTSWSNAPSVSKDLGDVSIQPGNSYVVATGDCKAGTTQSIELSSKGGLSLSFFEDYNPSPLGLFMTSC